MRSVKDIILKDTEPGPGLHEVVTCQAASYRQRLFSFPRKSNSADGSKEGASPGPEARGDW